MQLRLFTQEVTIFREDVLKKMLRHAVVQGCPEDVRLWLLGFVVVYTHIHMHTWMLTGSTSVSHIHTYIHIHTDRLPIEYTNTPYKQPEKADPLMECLVQSLLDQGHLCPLPLKVRPPPNQLL